MKVKIGELKANLSKYLQKLKNGGEPIEVCIREAPVAYLIPIGQRDKALIEDSLQLQGIRVTQWGLQRVDGMVSPGTCEKPAKGRNSVESIRNERFW